MLKSLKNISKSLDSSITGNAEDNVLRGNHGNNALHGGQGQDVAVFSGPSSQYIIRVDESFVTVRDRIQGGDGNDTLTSIEVLRFADGDVTPPANKHLK